MYYCSSMPENQSEDTPAADRDHLPVPPMSLARWGTEDEARELSEDIRVLLRDVLEVTVDSTTPFDPAAVIASAGGQGQGGRTCRSRGEDLASSDHDDSFVGSRPRPRIPRPYR